ADVDRVRLVARADHHHRSLDVLRIRAELDGLTPHEPRFRRVALAQDPGEAALQVAEGVGADAQLFAAGGGELVGDQPGQVVAQRAGAAELDVPVRVSLEVAGHALGVGDAVGRADPFAHRDEAAAQLPVDGVDV